MEGLNMIKIYLHDAFGKEVHKDSIIEITSPDGSVHRSGVECDSGAVCVRVNDVLVPLYKYVYEYSDTFKVIEPEVPEIIPPELLAMFPKGISEKAFKYVTIYELESCLKDIVEQIHERFCIPDMQLGLSFFSDSEDERDDMMIFIKIFSGKYNPSYFLMKEKFFYDWFFDYREENPKADKFIVSLY